MKKMNVLHCASIRELVDRVNDASIQNEDIVDILQRDEDIVLLYYK